MPKLTIRKSIVIDSPADKVFPAIQDFKQWKSWSPWLIAEPDCPLTYTEDGERYSWDGKIIGTGEMAKIGEEAPRSMDCQLTFLKPWKSVSKVRFELAAKDGGTEVTWMMDGSIPFFIFFLKKMMATFIGMDYERGLSMLKDYVETGAVPVKLDFPGTARIAGFSYIGIHTRCPISEIGSQMKTDMTRLGSLIAEHSIETTGLPLSVYHKWDPGKGIVDYTIGIPVAARPANLPEGLVSAYIPDCRTYPVQLTGPYRHLGNAWSAGSMHARAKIFQQDKSIHPFEIYQSDPTQVAENDLVTVVHFPAK